jgi:hypothetical protein
VGVLVVCTLYSEVFLNLTEVFLTLTEVFPYFLLSCKANARAKLAKTGHGPHSSTIVVIYVVRLLFVLFYVLFVCKCVLPPGDNPIAVNKYIISYHTGCRIDAVNSPNDEHMSTRNIQRFGINIYEKRIVRPIGHIQELYRDARSTKHKILLLVPVIVKSRLFGRFVRSKKVLNCYTYCYGARHHRRAMMTTTTDQSCGKPHRQVPESREQNEE